MRFWSLKTFRSTFRHGLSFHSYIDTNAVFMTYLLLLMPLPSKLSWARQHIPVFPQGLGFLPNPPSVLHWLTSLLQPEKG